MRTLSLAFIAFLAAGALAAPAPKLEGEALERALAKLNAPEPWEKRDPQYMIDGYEEPTEKKRSPQYMIDGYEEPGSKKRSPQYMIDGYEEPTEQKRSPQYMIDGYEEPTSAKL